MHLLRALLRCALPALVTLVAAVSCEGPAVRLAGPGDDDAPEPWCQQAACVAGSTACCPEGIPGVWNSALSRCVCSSAPCLARLCALGSVVCCPGGMRGTWSESLARCLCGTAADADADVDADAEAEAVFDADAEADVPDVIEDYHAEHGPRCYAELGGSCNPVFQCGCSAGERCVITGLDWSWAEECILIGTDPIDTPCASADNCVAQNQCFGDPDDDYICRQLCYSDDDCPAPRTCDLDIAMVTGYRLCGPTPDDCDPFTAAGCAEGEACIVSVPDDLVTCVAAGTLEPDETCDSASGDCRVGAACYVTDTSIFGRCYLYCSLDGSSHPCPSGESCENFGHPSVGVCVSG